MITRKDLAPLDGTSLELWRKELKHRKAKTLLDLYIFSHNFYAWPCRDHYKGEICEDCENHDFCQSCKLTTEEVKHELERRFPK